MPTQPSAQSVSASAVSTSRCIIVFGTKGGVGKTVVATNLAASLAQLTHQRVCLVDLDIMAVGDVAKMLNVQPSRPVVDLIPTLKQTSAPENLSLKPFIAAHASGVDVMVALPGPRQVNQLDPDALPKFFQALRHHYAYIVVDGGKVFSEALIAAFDAANLILLVSGPDVITLFQTKWALDLLESLLFPSSMVKAVLNRAESRGGVDTRDARVAIACEVIGEIPSDGRVVGTAINQGVPVVTDFGTTKVAEAFNRLAQTITSRPDLFIAHQDVVRRRRPGEGPSPAAPMETWASPSSATGENGEAAQLPDEIVLLKQRIHERLVEELNLKKLDLGTLASNTHMAELRRKTEGVIANLLAREVGGLIASHEVRARLVKEIADEALGFGPIEELLADPQVTDILVNNKDQVYIERRGKLELTNKKFISNDQVRAVIERIIAPLGRRIDESAPMVDARLPDGSRVNAIIPPLSIKGPVLSIRKFSRVRYGRDDLIRFGSLDANMAQFIEACVRSRKNMIISGGTGTGKTTLLNIVSAFIPEGERIITIEDSAELKLAQTHWVCLEARPSSIEGKGEVSIRDLFRNALRMRPDRIIIGECRGAETLDMLQAMNTGHDGSITTIHANAPRDVVSRMDSMVLMSNIELPIRAIREMVASAIDVVVHSARLSDGTRKITAVTELTGISQTGEVNFRDIFIFRQTGVAADGTVEGRFEATGTPPTFMEELTVKGIGLDAAIFQRPSG